MNILITGTNRGIGFSLTRQLSEKGHTLWAVCRQPSEQLQSLASNANVNIISGVDVTADNAATLIHEALGTTQLDVLIQNAGILTRESIENAAPEAITQQFKVNALAPLTLTIALKKHLTKGSKVALITSRMGSMTDNGSGNYYGYRMSKAALNAAGVSLARDLHGEGIAVALLHPGFVQTDMVNHAGDISADTAAERLIQRIEELNIDNTGTFWHSNGEVLPF
ncbi:MULTISPECIES: SDR family oxidoreductase [Gammaproteobacteria]|uniref:SDR family oxidoreductase n=1 Tax=Gammaproteobacteria TaxID=1236 RepID=UPI000DCFA937|nr:MULTISPECIES: SDR family oxidoreductase [Gammaproteobacteria]RTE87442.1 SDR family oxidoreductase [Aliidiomarina sp. B3213]TCZ92773.1 SDR family oxidoreductase [Lysobacter sp. N42]